MIKLNELKKDKLKAIFRNDKIVGAISEDSDVSYFNDKELYIKEIDSFEFYYNGNYDEDNKMGDIINQLMGGELKISDIKAQLNARANAIYDAEKKTFYDELAKR